jgi:hypothetical protein
VPSTPQKWQQDNQAKQIAKKDEFKEKNGSR